MIIKEVKGNAITMFENGEGHLIHGCNCFCNMGAGIAKEVKQRVPGAFRVDFLTEKGSRKKLGSNSLYHHLNGMVLFNAYTQYTYGPGQQVDYNAIRSCFINAVATAQKLNPGEAHIPILTPLIGAGHGGGDWEVIREIIDRVTVLYPVIVVHYDPKAK